MVGAPRLGAGQAKVASPEEVEIIFPSCSREPFSFDAATRTLEVELRQEGVLRVWRGARRDAAVAWVEVAMPCSPGGTQALVRVHDPSGRDALRVTELGDMPAAARPQEIALAAVELACSIGWMPERGADAPEPASSDSRAGPPPPPPSSAPAPAPRPPAPTLQPEANTTPDARSPMAFGRSRALEAALATEVFLSDPTLLLGARLGGRYARLRAGLEMLTGGRTDALGSVTLTLVSGTVGLDLIQGESRSVGWAFGPRLAAGAVLASAQALATAHADRAREPYVDVAVQGRLDGRWGDAAAGFLSLEAGAARGIVVRADERHAGSVSGIFLGARVGGELF